VTVMNDFTHFPPPLTPEQARSRRLRNLAVGLAIAFLVALFYVVTIVKLGSNAIPRAM
jgi:hypothetical protein